MLLNCITSFDLRRVWNWFFILLSAASQSLRQGSRIDPCTPTGYSHNVESWKFSPSSESDRSQYQLTVQTRGNFSECRSAALMLLQRGKGHIYFCKFVLLDSFIKLDIFTAFVSVLKLVISIFIYAEKCSHQHCEVGSTSIPQLQGKFLATENFFHTSKVLL